MPPSPPPDRLVPLLATLAVVVVAMGVVAVVMATTTGEDDDTVAATSEPTRSAPDATAPPATDAPRPPDGGDGTAPAERACPGDGWELRRRLGQLLMVGVDPAGTAEARHVVEVDGVGGIFVGGDPTDLLTSGELRDLGGPDDVAPFVAVDDEGGRVQRIDALAGDLPSARRMAAGQSADEVRGLAEQRGRELLELGVTVDFAPVVDVSDRPDGEVIGDRSFGDGPDTVVTYAGAFAEGLRRAGVLAVPKHFPGHGRADGDSHLGTATTPPIGDLDPDLAPYRALLPDAGAVMVGHLVVPELTDGEPASLSPAAVDGLLRDELGFDGVVFTDDLGAMRAVTDRYGLAESIRLALVAGADVALVSAPTDVAALLDALEADVAAGTLPAATVDDALGRVLRAKGHACG
jgi:beta-N-acetylhexosaminidase